MLALTGVSKSYQQGTSTIHALRNVSLSALPGTCTAVMGPSGCGKSTLLTVAGGLQPPDEGSVMVDTTELTTLPEGPLFAHRRRHIGFVFQDYNLVPMLSAVENVGLAAELDGVPRRQSRQEAGRALASVGLAGYEDRLPSSLSGGEQQRVALARAYCGEARLILADEPTGALDYASATMVLHSLAALVAEGATCVLVTHDPRVADYADRVVTMRDGVVVSTGEGESRA